MNLILIHIQLEIVLILIAGVNSVIYTTVENGESTSIICSDEKTDKCTLTKKFSDLIINRNTSINDKFKIRNLESCIIDLHNVNRDDSGYYECDIGSDKNITYNILVIVKPNIPEILYNDKILINNTKNTVYPNENGNVTLKCQAKQSYPKAIFSWYVDGIVNTNHHEKTEADTNDLWDSHSELTINFDQEINKKKQIKCVIHHNSYNSSIFLVGMFEIAPENSSS